MAKCAFKWFLDGAEFDMPGLTIAGKREMNTIKSKRVKVLAAVARSQAIARMSAIVSVKRNLELNGVRAAKEQWEALLPSLFSKDAAEDMVWPEEQFAENLEGWLKYEVYEQLDVSDIETAREKLKEETREANKDFDLGQYEEHGYEALFCDMRWRLGQLSKTIKVGGDEVEMTDENLAKVVTYPEDARVFYDACAGKARSVDPDIELQRPTEEQVAKN